MTRFGSIPVTLAAAALAFRTSAEARLSGQDVTVLEVDRAIERPLAPRDEHRYTVALATGECVSIIVLQQGIDVVVDVLDAGGEKLAEVQEEVGRSGEEHVDVAARTTGTYKLDMLSRGARQHPFYWASFIQSGEWADLDGHR